MYRIVKRIIDIAVSLSLGILLLPIAGFIALAIKVESDGPILFWSERVGINNKIFIMPKFRTMIIDTPSVATHQLQNANSYITKLGGVLRKTSLDEMPQLWSVIMGDMSLVGPRPALYSQSDLIQLRTQAKVHEIPPGITGWAQVNGRDEISIQSKVIFDSEYLRKKSILFDLKILFLTISVVLKKESVKH